MRPTSSLDAAYFENMFRTSADPWRFETSPYEAAKYDATLLVLGDRHFAAGFEVGCANGVLTRRLATRCAKLLAVDVSASALSRAQARCADLTHVTFEEMTFPAQRPAGDFDLIVMSEVVYYWSDDDIRIAGDFIDRHVMPGGELLLVHWTGETDYPQSGDAAVELLRQRLRHFAIVRADRTDRYRLDLWRQH